ncbi:MAG: methyltransferase domain-containing protein [Alphaproteobacteria bacterium]|nr:methyltransferase domain-containing protein [Alphaproteobacteria bacterium]
MEILSFISLVVLFIIIAAILIVSIVFIYFTVSSGFMHSSPPVPSCGKVKDAMLKDVAEYLRDKEGKIVMDLGSGWGTLLLPLAKQFPQHTFIGIEYGRIPYMVSCLRAKKYKNARFYRQNFFDTDISQADVIFLFLLNSTMAKLSNKCISEAKKGAYAYANRFPIQGKEPQKEVSLGSKYYTYYIYKF